MIATVESEASKYLELRNNLELLGMHQMSQNLDNHLDAVQNGSEGFTDALLELTRLERKAKEVNVIQAIVKTANFPFLKTMEDFDFSWQPGINKQEIYGFKDLRFIENKENILFVGNPGVGKTHLSVSIGIEAARNRKITYFITCNDLILNLKKAMWKTDWKLDLKTTPSTRS